MEAPAPAVVADPSATFSRRLWTNALGSLALLVGLCVLSHAMRDTASGTDRLACAMVRRALHHQQMAAGSETPLAKMEHLGAAAATMGCARQLVPDARLQRISGVYVAEKVRKIDSSTARLYRAAHRASSPR